MSRAEERRAERGMQKVPRINGKEVVAAVTVHDGPADAKGNRMYQAIVCAPQTLHTNGEVIALLAMLACTPVFGEAQASNGKVSLQAAIDDCARLFKSALEEHVHRMVASGNSVQNLKTVKMERSIDPGSTN